MGALGPFVPFEAWPDPTRTAIAAAYVVKAEALAARIREQLCTARCTCARPATPADDGRCSRCWGRPRVEP
jgi:hypothetical protein